jgi:hypothetical protein
VPLQPHATQNVNNMKQYNVILNGLHGLLDIVRIAAKEANELE